MEQWVAFKLKQPIINARQNEGAPYGVATVAGWEICRTGWWETRDHDGRAMVMSNEDFQRMHERANWTDSDADTGADAT